MSGRRGRGPLIDVRNVHTQEALRILDVPTGRDRTLADARQRKADPNADKPKRITGNVDDGSAVESLLKTLQLQGRVLDQTERGGKFGDQIHNATLVNANSPLFAVKTQGSSDDPSTTSTTDTAPAITDVITLGPGKWAAVVIGGVHLSHNTGGSVGVCTEIEGIQGTVRTVSSVGTDGIRCFADQQAIAEADWIQGEQDLNVRVRFRSSTAGTTSAKNPMIITIAWRME